MIGDYRIYSLPLELVLDAKLQVSGNTRVDQSSCMSDKASRSLTNYILKCLMSGRAWVEHTVITVLSQL